MPVAVETWVIAVRQAGDLDTTMRFWSTTFKAWMQVDRVVPCPSTDEPWHPYHGQACSKITLGDAILDDGVATGHHDVHFRPGSYVVVEVPGRVSVDPR